MLGLLRGLRRVARAQVDLRERGDGLRGDTSIEERARFDNYYIENWSLWLDIQICLLTVGAVLREVAGHRRSRRPTQAAAEAPVRLVDPVSELR